MKTNLKKYIDSPTWIGHLLLENSEEDYSDKLVKLTSQEKFDLEDCDLVVTVNGVEFRAEKLENFLKYAIDRYSCDLLEDREKFDRLVTEKAEELIRDKVYDVTEKLNTIEQNCEMLIDKTTWD